MVNFLSRAHVLDAPLRKSRNRHSRFCDAPHLCAEWRNCRRAATALSHADTLKRLCLRICDDLQLSVLGNAFFQFEPSGVTGTIFLADSHIALHTWPEKRMLKADIHFPNDNGHPGIHALLLFENLKQHFQPEHSSIAQAGFHKKRAVDSAPGLRVAGHGVPASNQSKISL